MFIESQATDPVIHALAIRPAHECRHIIQAVLGEEERDEADRGFYRVIREGLEEYRARAGRTS